MLHEWCSACEGDKRAFCNALSRDKAWQGHTSNAHQCPYDQKEGLLARSPLTEARSLAQVKLPEALQQQLEAAMEKAGIPVPDSPERWQAAHKALKVCLNLIEHSRPSY